MQSFSSQITSMHENYIGKIILSKHVVLQLSDILVRPLYRVSLGLFSKTFFDSLDICSLLLCLTYKNWAPSSIYILDFDDPSIRFYRRGSYKLSDSQLWIDLS